MKIKLIIVLLITVTLCSCFEEDERIVPIEIDEIEIPHSMYQYQTYFNLTNNSVISYNDYADWDLGFESSDEGYHIILNSAKYMYAGNTYETDFYSVKSGADIDMIFDPSSGNIDALALNDWADFSNPADPVFNNYVYIIDRGKNELGEEFGLKKVVFEKMENDTFYIHFANIDGTEEFKSKVPKNKDVNFVLFSLDNGGKIEVSEPDKETWDVCFTKYSTIIPDNNGVPTDYLVRGVLLNPYKNIEVALDTINHFYEIFPDMINDYSYSASQDAIGYDWKVYQNDVYEVRDYYSFILKEVNGFNYKLRFTSFYNDLGEKGYPAFELLLFE